MLSMHVVERRLYGMKATALSGAGFGEYREGVCKDGADFFCETRGGIFSCMPCNFPQLQTFKDLQIAVNTLLESHGLATRIERGPKARSAIDGRIGPSTTAAVGALASVMEGEVPPSGLAAQAIHLAKTAPGSEAAMRAMAAAAPEVYDWLGRVGTVLEEPLPAPGSVPLSTKRKALAVVAFGTAALAAVGLIGTALYQKGRL